MQWRDEFWIQDWVLGSKFPFHENSKLTNWFLSNSFMNALWHIAMLIWLWEMKWTQSHPSEKKQICPGFLSEAQSRERKILFFSVSLRAMLRIPNYAIITHKGFTATQKLTFISFSASWCCVNKAAACVLSCCTHSVKALLLYNAFCFCDFSKPVFLLFCE